MNGERRVGPLLNYGSGPWWLARLEVLEQHLQGHHHIFNGQPFPDEFTLILRQKVLSKLSSCCILPFLNSAAAASFTLQLEIAYHSPASSASRLFSRASELLRWLLFSNQQRCTFKVAHYTDEWLDTRLKSTDNSLLKLSVPRLIDKGSIIHHGFEPG